MSEACTMADESSKVNVRCPFPDTRRSNCIGKYCMAWVREIGSDGKDTGRGRCGMVGSLRSPEKLKFTQEDGRELTDAVHRLFDFLHRYTAPHISFAEAVSKACYGPLGRYSSVQ